MSEMRDDHLLLLYASAAVSQRFSAILSRQNLSKTVLISSFDECRDYVETPERTTLLIVELNPVLSESLLQYLTKLFDETQISVLFLYSDEHISLLDQVQAIPAYGYLSIHAAEVVLVNTIQTAFRLIEQCEIRTLFETFTRYIPGAVFIIDEHNTLLFCNDRYAALVGLPAKEIIGKKGETFTPEILDLQYRTENDAVLKSNALKIIESYSRRDENRTFWMTYKFPITVRGKKAVAALSFDISDKRKAEEALQKELDEKEFLLRESHHRIKNNMAVIVSILRFQADSLNSCIEGSLTTCKAEEAIREAISRIYIMQELYEKMHIDKEFQNINVKQYLGNLIDSVESFFHNLHQSVKIIRDIESFSLNTKSLFYLGIILNELLTNAIKYAFPGSVGNAQICITVSFSAPHVLLTVHDNGKGLSENVLDVSRDGFGLTLVKLLSEQLDGDMSIENRSGCRVHVAFPLK